MPGNKKSDSDSSPTENPIWIQQRRYEERAAARINAQEREQNHSDSDLLPTHQLRARPRPRGSVSEIANALTNTSFEEPEIRLSSRLPFSRSRNIARERAELATEALYERAEEMASVEARERRHRLLVEETDAREADMRAFRNRETERELEDELVRRIEEFAQSDPEAHRSWADHYELASRTAIIRAHLYQMLQWYTGGPEGSIQDASRSVPPRLLRQIRRVEQYYTHLERLEFRFHQAEFADGSREIEPIDEGGMASMSDHDLFGYELRSAHSAFTQYYFATFEAEGDEEARLAHVRDSFAARRIRVLHAASEEEFDILLRRLRSFVWSALVTFSDLTETDNDQLPADFQERVISERAVLGRFQQDLLQYQGPSGGVRAAEEDDAASIYEPIQSGVAAAAAEAMEDGDDEDGDDGDDETSEVEGSSSLATGSEERSESQEAMDEDDL